MKKDIFTKKEVEKYLQISPVTLHNYVKKGLLRPLGIERKVYFKKSEVMEALEKGYNNSDDSQ